MQCKARPPILTIRCRSSGVSANKPASVCSNVDNACDRRHYTGSQGRQDVWRLSDGNGGEVAVRVNGRVESNFGELLRDAHGESRTVRRMG